MAKLGKLIVIEGADGSGKQTQTKLLIDRLNSEGFPTKSMTFPRYDTPAGRIVGQCYLGKKNLGRGDVGWFGDPTKLDPKVSSLYYAADRLVASPEIESILEEGTNLALDRYYQANMAHQGSKIESASKRGSFFEFVRILELELLKIPKEDLAILLYMPSKVAGELLEKRGGEADLHENDMEHLLKSEKAYLHMVNNYPYAWKQVDCAPDGTINSLRSPENIAEEVYSHVVNLIKK